MTKNEYANLLGAAIKAARTTRGFTLDEVTDWLGNTPSRSSLSAIENGKQDVNAYDLFRLEKLLGYLPRPEIKLHID